MEQFSLTMNEAEALDTDSLVLEKGKTKVKSYTRKPRSGSIEDVLPEGLPVETVEHHPDDIRCSSCGTEMTIIGKEVHRSLKIIPPQYSVVEDVYYTYACKDCEKRTDEAVIVKAPKPAAMRSIPLFCMSTGRTARRLTRRNSSRDFRAGCTRTATRATIVCRLRSVSQAAGHTQGANLTKR